VVEGGGFMVEAGEKFFLEHDYHDFLPECEKDGDFDGEEFKECSIGSERFVKCMIKQNKVVEGV
jgi:hypothetical protein